MHGSGEVMWCIQIFNWFAVCLFLSFPLSMVQAFEITKGPTSRSSQYRISWRAPFLGVVDLHTFQQFEDPGDILHAVRLQIFEFHVLASIDLFHVSPYFPRYPVEVFQPHAHHDEGSSSELVVERQAFHLLRVRRLWSILSLSVCFASNTTARPPGERSLEVRLPGFGVASKEPALSVWLPEWLLGSGVFST